MSNSFTIDSIPPTIATVDTVGDTLGKISGLLVHFSESVNTASIATNQFSTSFGATFASGYTIVDPQTIEFPFTSATGTTALTGTLSYSGASVHDIAGNLLAPVTKNITDKTSPVILSTAVFDNDGNGKVDRIRAYWSEPVANTVDTGAWTINNPLSGVGASPLSVSVSGNTATLVLSEPASANTSSGGMTLSFTANSNWKDISSSSNQASSFPNSILLDQAIPVMTRLQTIDDSGIYSIEMVFSEPMTGTLSGFTLSGSATYTGTVLQPTVNTIRFITADPTTTDTAKIYSLSYSGSGAYLADAGGNYLANFSDRNVTDAIAPKILTRTTVDSNGNGKIDGVRIGFSEPVTGSSSGVTVSVAGYVVTGYSISGTGITANITEASVSDTSATPPVQFQNTTLADAGANLVPSEASATVSTDAV